MIPKKSGKADLRNDRVLFFETGLLIALLAVVLVFHYGTGRSGSSAVRAAFPDMPEQAEWSDPPAFEIATGSRPKMQGEHELFVSDKIEIVKEMPEIPVREDSGEDKTANVESTAEGNSSMAGRSGNPVKKEPAEGKSGADGSGPKKIDYLFISFTPLPNPKHTVDGVIIIPYTVGSRIDWDRMDRYVSLIELFVRNGLPPEYKPLITELPLDHFAAEQHRYDPIPRELVRNTGNDRHSIRTLLTVHEWKANISGSEYCTFLLRYKNQKEVKNITVGNRRNSGQTIKNYYLSDTVETHFDKKQARNTKNGRYIVLENYSGVPEVVEILEISDSVLVTRLLPDKLPIRYHAVQRHTAT